MLNPPAYPQVIGTSRLEGGRLDIDCKYSKHVFEADLIWQLAQPVSLSVLLEKSIQSDLCHPSNLSAQRRMRGNAAGDASMATLPQFSSVRPSETPTTATATAAETTCAIRVH